MHVILDIIWLYQTKPSNVLPSDISYRSQCPQYCCFLKKKTEVRYPFVHRKAQLFNFKSALQIKCAISDTENSCCMTRPFHNENHVAESKTQLGRASWIVPDAVQDVQSCDMLCIFLNLFKISISHKYQDSSYSTSRVLLQRY